MSGIFAMLVLAGLAGRLQALGSGAAIGPAYADQDLSAKRFPSKGTSRPGLVRSPEIGIPVRRWHRFRTDQGV